MANLVFTTKMHLTITAFRLQMELGALETHLANNQVGILPLLVPGLDGKSGKHRPRTALRSAPMPLFVTVLPECAAMHEDSVEISVSPGKLAERAGLSKSAIYRRIRERTLPHSRVGKLIRLPLAECLRRLVVDVPAVDTEGQGNG